MFKKIKLLLCLFRKLNLMLICKMRYLGLVSLFFLGFAPLGNLDRIKRAFEKLEFDKAHELILKAYEKDPDNAGAIYYSALLYFTESFKGFDPDTARLITINARERFEKSNEEVKLELEEDGVTLQKIDELSISIRDRVYAEVDANISVRVAENFMTLYPNSPYNARLVFRRDSIVFDQVRKNDSLGVYERFLDEYKTEEFREIAIKRIDELRYQVLAHTGELSDYYKFLEKYPGTRFRDDIEAFIFKKATVDHRSTSYISFMQFANNQKLIKKAADILYYLQKENSFEFDHPQKDSLSTIEQMEDLQLITAVEDGKFGFHTREGSLQIDYAYDDVAYEYKCDLTDSDWLFVKSTNSNQIINKSGVVVVPKLSEHKDLSFGAALVRHGNQSFLYHKSGFKILETDVRDADVMGGRWIRVLKNGKWALVSFSGSMLTDFEFDDIRMEGEFWVFEKGPLLAVYNEDLIDQDLHEGGLDLEFKFEDLELVNDTVLIGFRDDRECMLDNQLKFLIPWGVYEINPDDSGWYLRTRDGYRLYNHSEQDIMNQVHPYLETNAGWLAVKTSEDWMLLPRTSDVEPSRGYDSLKLLNDFSAFSKAGEEDKLAFSNGSSIEINNRKVRSFFNQPNYLLIEDEEIRSVVDSTGEVRIEGVFDEVTFFNDSLIKVKLEGKSGLVKLDSSFVLDLEYDAIDEDDGLVLSLKEGMIGCLDLGNGTVISPSYESRIERIGPNYLVKQGGKFGLVDAAEDSVLSFMYDEIKFWNDTSHLVRNGVEWNFVNHKEEQIEEPISFLSEILSNEEEAIFKYVRDGKYGLLSNRNGFLLSPEFTDIFNIGSDTDPVFFADQHLDKAGFHVVSYLNKEGDLLLSKAYTLEEFDKILCDN